MTYEQVYEQALQLDANQRERLAMKLLHGVDLEPDVTPEMLAEWHRRADEARDNPTQSIPYDEWKAKMNAKRERDAVQNQVGGG